MDMQTRPDEPSEARGEENKGEEGKAEDGADET